jgi:polyphenol oxidase
VIRVAEEPQAGSGDVRFHTHPGWRDVVPGIVQGITAGADMSLFGGAPTGAVVPRWLALAEALGCDTVVHARQVHGADIIVHDAAVPGLLIAGAADGHATSLPETLLAVSVADCVPIYIAAPERRAIAMLHGGWRGVAAGVFEAGLHVLRSRFAVAAADVWVHCGPAICGECFEVGPEVPAGLGLQPPPDGGRTRIDLRAHIADRARAAGVRPDRTSLSAHCTRCGDSPFYSHRAGCAERQIAFLGIAPG